MTCQSVRRWLPGSLDGGLGAREQAQLHAHLAACAACRSELAKYRQLSALMSRVERATPPADLAVRVRYALNRARDAEPWGRRAWSRITITAENMLAPLALPATGGVLSALLTFSLVFYNLLLGVPIGAVANDIPIHRIQPARLEALAPFPVPGEDSFAVDEEQLLLVEAVVNEHGQAVDYRILVGPDTVSVRRQLDSVVFFSRYRPQHSFGRATPGGRVILSFSEVRVRG